MRIAMVSEHASPLATLGGVDAGGQNVHVAALADALAARGHDVAVYTRADSPDLPERIVTASGVVVEHVVAGPRTYVAKDDLLPHMGAFADGLARRWSQDRPDVVHAHFWMSGMTSIRAAALSDVPVVATFHALGTVKQRWQKADDTSPAERIATERGIARSADRIIATCRDEVAELRAMGVPTAHVDVIPCGVDTSLFRPASTVDPAVAAGHPQHRPDRPRRLLVLGRLVPRKGIEDAIRALAPIPGAELLVVGGPAAADLDDDPEVARLRRVAAATGVADRVTFAGHVARPALPGVIRSCDVVLAVPWYEPFGIVPIEAMACGVPVVATAVGGMLDTVVDGVTGLLVEPGAPDRIAAAARALLADDHERLAMGRRGAERVRALYTWKRIAAQTERSYETVLAARTTAARMEASR
jgi:glycosyltransferase involved in cell wall biosynthesis